MANPKGNPQNLRNMREWTDEEKVLYKKKANETKEKNKLFKQMCQEMLNNIDKASGKTNREIIMDELMRRAKGGDTRALSLMYKMSGEDVKQIEVIGDTPIKIDLTK